MSKLVFNFPVNMLICHKQKVLQRFVFRHPCPSYRCCCQYENFLLLPGLANGMSAKITLSSRCAAAGGSCDEVSRPSFAQLHICTVAHPWHTPQCGASVGIKWVAPFLYTHPRRPQTQVTTLCSTRKYLKCVHRAIIWPWLGKQGGSRSRVSPLWKQSRVPS